MACGLALSLLSVVPAVAQGTAGEGLADRIAERRDAADLPAQQAAPAEQVAADVVVQGEAGLGMGAGAGSLAGEAAAQVELPVREEELLPLGREPGAVAERGDGVSTPKLGAGWLLNTMAALGVVIALILGLRWVARRSGVAGKAVGSSAAVEVLSRTTIAPRNHIVLLRVGPRVLVVNDSGQGMRTLANIDEPTEVAELLRSVQSQQAGSASQSFSGVMSRLAGGQPETDDIASSPSERSTEQVRDTLAGLRGRLSGMAGGKA